MIVPMTRVRIAGPRPGLEAVLAALQDAAILHVDRPPVERDRPDVDDPRLIRERRHFERCLADVETALVRLEAPHADVAPAAPTSIRASVRRARRVRREADRLALIAAALGDEDTRLRRYGAFYDAFSSLVGHELTWPDGQAFYVVLRAGADSALAALSRNFETAVGGEVELFDRSLDTGERAVLILASARAAPKVSALIAAARVEELPTPTGLGETSLLRAMPALTARLAAIPGEMAAIDARRRALLDREGAWLRGHRAFLRDRLLLLDARSAVHAARHLFVIEGWIPAGHEDELRQRLAGFGPELVITILGAEHWTDGRAPVRLDNPPLFRPFELITRTLPLPRYGSIDPTPFVAIFFPAFFGLMLGDAGYGAVLAAISLALLAAAPRGSTRRSIAVVGLACASSSVVFGLVFGEIFGTVGRALGLQPLFDREEGTVAFLALAIALGGVHILLGLLLGVLTLWRGGHRRQAAGRGVIFAMLVLTALALLAALEVLPRAWFTPSVITVLVAFPVLVALEGVVAVVELLSAFGHVLSYARIMALGTASLMLAVVANRMVGAMGSVVVGVVFALLFHVVNFAIGLFSPAIHALRLHYVEFFGEFFSPGGTPYRPLGHWHPSS